jgi:hypothetical protein
MLARHASFDPRMAREHRSRRREHRSSAGGVAVPSGLGGAGGASVPSGSGGGPSGTTPNVASEAWAQLVRRTQALEEDLLSERASKRLQAARSSQEKAALLLEVAKLTEAKEGMEQLWRDSKMQLTVRLQEWEHERQVHWGRQLGASGVRPPAWGGGVEAVVWR